MPIAEAARILYSNEAQRVKRELEELEDKNEELSDDLLVCQQHLDQAGEPQVAQQHCSR